MKILRVVADFHRTAGHMIIRENILGSVDTALRRSPVVVLTGPRQCGKTTLARQLLSAESRRTTSTSRTRPSLARLDEPMTALATLEGLVVIDEVQRRPDLFPVLRVLADRRDPVPARFLILGSASGDLLRQTSESLAGRAERITHRRIHARRGWRRRAGRRYGCAAGSRRRSSPPPRATASRGASSSSSTLLERDLPQWGVRVPAAALLRFWTMRGALPRTDVERRRRSARALGVSEAHCAPLPRPAHGRVHGQAAAARTTPICASGR